MKVIRHTDANFAAKLREADRRRPACLIRKSSNAPAPSSTPCRCMATPRCWNSRNNSTARNSPPTGWPSRRRNCSTPRSPPMNRCARPWPRRRKTSPPSPKNRCAKTGRRKIRTARRVGEKFDPFQRVGVYIPGGKAPLVSTALMTITLAKVGGLPGNCRLHAVRQGRRHQSGAAVRHARGGRDGDLPRRRGAGDCGDGLRHEDDSPRAERFSVPATPTSSPPNGCSSAMSRLICCPGRANCWCWRTTRPTRNSLPPTCWRRPNTAPATNASGW